MADTPTPTTKQQEVASTMAAKLKLAGPLALNEDEADELRASLRAVFARDDRLLLRLTELEATNQVNICMAEALQRQGFVMKHELNPDGSHGWNLQTKADADAETVN